MTTSIVIDPLERTEDWVARISGVWQQSVLGIIETGRLLIEAKAALPHGAFGKMIESELPFGARAAQMLMTVAADARLTNRNTVSHLPPSWGTLYELTKLDDAQFEAKIADGTIRPDMERREVINGARSIMGSRQEPNDSLDYFPTPPWATRALMEHVIRGRLNRATDFRFVLWEPACGEGHIAEVLREYNEDVFATDVFDYGYGDKGDVDFLNCDDPNGIDWIITNPPFGDKTEAFVLRAIELARDGVAMFVRLQWLESVGRYEEIFKDHPPTLIAFFAERVNLCKGRWEPEGTTATAYIWLVWRKDMKPQAPFWIPPGCREQLTKPDDAERFTAHPVIRSPMTDDGTSKHSLSLEPATTPETQKGRTGDSQMSITPTSVQDDVSGNGTPGRPSVEGEPASVVVTGAGSLSSEGVLV